MNHRQRDRDDRMKRGQGAKWERRDGQVYMRIEADGQEVVQEKQKKAE